MERPEFCDGCDHAAWHHDDAGCHVQVHRYTRLSRGVKKWTTEKCDCEEVK